MIVVEHHHHVLSAWAELRSRCERPPHLLTFDFHTDTLKAFNVYAYKALRLQLGREPTREEHESECARLCAAIDFNNAESVRQALRWLRHDEHIDAARRADMIDKVAVILSANEPGNEPAFATLYKPRSETPLETATLTPHIEAIELQWGAALPECAYIADIDLDFFRSARSMAPGDASAFLRVLRHAALITVARESECVLGLRLPGEAITADDLEHALARHVSAARANAGEQ